MFVSGGKTLGAANVVERLVNPGAAANNRVTNVVISATGDIVVGNIDIVATPDAARVGALVPGGSAIAFSVSDLADVFVAGTTGGERVSWSAKAI